MKIAVLCEFSGVVRDAFILLGHDAISCDLESTEKPGPHIQGDCRNYDWSGYDLVICCPPCTSLCRNSAKWEHTEKQIKEAIELFMFCWNLKNKMVCIENPVPRKILQLPTYTQIIQPWQYGHDYSKKTCLWLKGLQKLISTKIVKITYITTASGKMYTAGWYKTPRNGKDRSRFFPGIARAMAEQWGNL